MGNECGTLGVIISWYKKKEMNQIRAKTEAELKAQGVQIDTSYQDPALVSKK